MPKAPWDGMVRKNCGRRKLFWTFHRMGWDGIYHCFVDGFDMGRKVQIFGLIMSWDGMIYPSLVVGIEMEWEGRV